MKGGTILAIGGWIGSTGRWQEPLAVVSDDHRGFGRSTARPDAIHFESLSDAVLALLDANGVRQCVLAAQSAIALRIVGSKADVSVQMARVKQPISCSARRVRADDRTA